jgi:hypothetical protein
MDNAEKWLRDDDRQSLASRAARVREITQLFPMTEDGLITFGGGETGIALIESRLAYVNGLYVCTVLAALAVLERHFAGMLYIKGLESAKRMGFDDLLKRAERESLVAPEDKPHFDQFRHLRNAYAHFREPAHELSSLRRSIKEDLPFQDLLRKDAQTALGLLGRYFSRSPYPAISLTGAPPASS